MNKRNLPRSEFFASLTPDIKTLDDFLDEEEREYLDRNGNVLAREIYPKRQEYGTLPPLPHEPRNSPAALSERRRAIRRADFAREVIGWVIVAAAIVALGYILL